MRFIRSTLLLGGAFLAGIPLIQAQEITIDPSQLKVMNPVPAVKEMQLTRPQAIAPFQTNGPVQPALKVWPYTFTSQRGDGGTYSGTIVGASPFNRGARATNIPVVIIPLRIQFTGAFIGNFDPTSPDDGCLGAGHTALSLTQDSPVFNPVANHTMNGVNLGNVTYPDAFQRASFWPQISANAPAYHLGLNPVTLASTHTIAVTYGTANSTVFGLSSSCSNNAANVDNPKQRLGVININYIDPILNNIITTLGLNHSQFPLFIIYSVVISDGDARSLNNCCILGYHNGSGDITDAGQTYGIAEYDQSFIFSGTKDISVLTHEVMEWINDPSTNNLVPPWGGVGQVPPGFCQDNLETGDPLSGTLAPAITMPNGVTYHPQEQAFFGWFLGAPPTPGPYGAGAGAGNKYSSNGTFGGFAKLPCPPGGSN